VLIDTLVICAPAGLPPTKSNRTRRQPTARPALLPNAILRRAC